MTFSVLWLWQTTQGKKTMRSVSHYKTTRDDCIHRQYVNEHYSIKMITDLGLRSSWISFLRSLKHPRLVMAWRTSGSQSSSVGRMRVWTTDIIGNSNSSSPPRHPALPATTQVWRWISASCGQHHKTNPHAVATACQFSRVNNNHMPRSLQLSRWPPTHTRLNRTYNSSLLVCPSPNVIVIISKFSIILSSTSDADRGVILSTSDLSTSTWDAMEMSLIHSFILVDAAPLPYIS